MAKYGKTAAAKVERAMHERLDARCVRLTTSHQPGRLQCAIDGWETCLDSEARYLLISAVRQQPNS